MAQIKKITNMSCN